MSFATNASHWTNTATNITSLKFLDSGAGTEFGVGTKIEIWAPQPFSVAASSMTDDATVSYCFDRRDQALVTADAVPLRFYAAGNRRVDGDNPIRATFFFIPAIR